MCGTINSWFYFHFLPRISNAVLKLFDRHNTKYLQSFDATIDSDDKLESYSFVNKNRSLSFSSAKQTEGTECLQKPEKDCHFVKCVDFTIFYAHPIPVFQPEITYQTFFSSLVFPRPIFVFDPVETSAHGKLTLYKTCSNVTSQSSFWFFHPTSLNIYQLHTSITSLGFPEQLNKSKSTINDR